MGDDVALVSVMLVNNEIGVVQPIADIAAIAHSFGAVMHCDAAQALRQDPDRCRRNGHRSARADGAQDLRPQGRRRALSSAVYHADAAAARRRAGRWPVGHAADGADRRSGRGSAHRDGRRWPPMPPHARALRDRLAGGAYRAAMSFMAAAHNAGRAISTWGFPASPCRCCAHLPGLALSSGSACSAVTGRPSHVLTALGLSDAEARAALRLGFGRFTTAPEMIKAAEDINAASHAAARRSRSNQPHDPHSLSVRRWRPRTIGRCPRGHAAARSGAGHMASRSKAPAKAPWPVRPAMC